MSKNNSEVLINTARESFFFTFSELDCHKLATGKCTFDLSEEEYTVASRNCTTHHFEESRVGYCREIFDSMNRNNDFENRTGISGSRNACGHIGLSDGQHRSCIAKKRSVKKLMFDRLTVNPHHICGACNMDN